MTETDTQVREQDALDQLTSAVMRLKAHQCDLDYIIQLVEEAYREETQS